jgi:CheY-like chemotaxis protein
LINLVGNALKFTTQGKVQVEIVEKELITNGDKTTIILEFGVLDTGIGMTEAEAAKLFQPFVQADGSTTRKYGGTGLGLTICKRLVEIMGGKIWLVSKPDEGSLFSFTVQLEKLANSEEDTQPSISYELQQLLPDLDKIKNKIGGSRVLLAEDNPINQLVAVEILEHVGLSIDVANNGAQALEMVTQTQYDAVLMDIQMPIMDGHTAARKIRALEGFEELPIIAMTAHARATDREKSLASGMNDHISKPIKQKILCATLIQWIPEKKRVLPDTNIQKSTDNHVMQFFQELPGLDVESALERLNHNHKLFRSILLEFQRNFASAPQDVTLLLDGKRKRDRQEAQDIIHSVKGMASNLSAHDLFTVASALEIAIEEERSEEWPQYLEQFKVVLGQILEITLKVETVTIPPGSVNREAVAITAKELAKLLLDTDFEAQET